SAYSVSTLTASATSTAWKNASRHSAAVRSPASGETSATQTVAPSAENSIAASRPIPPAAPVMTHTFPSRRPIDSGLGRVEDGLGLAVAVERLHPELAAEAGLLEPTERCLHADGAVRVDRDDAGLERPRDAERAAAVARPDRAGQ